MSFKKFVHLSWRIHGHGVVCNIPLLSFQDLLGLCDALSILIQEICVLSLSFMASLSRGLKILLIFADIINAKPIN